MLVDSKNVYPYDSLFKFTESHVECPICHYYFKVNPRTDSMKYRIKDSNQIHFFTQHTYNSVIHIVIIEYSNFKFSKIIDCQESLKLDSSVYNFPLFHFVTLTEYQTFRDRVLELESNNNDLITTFKAKLEKLEVCYKDKDTELSVLYQTKNCMSVQNSLLENELSILRDEFLTVLQKELDSTKLENFKLLTELLSNRIELNNISFNNSQLQAEINDNQLAIKYLKTQLLESNKKMVFLTDEISSFKVVQQQKEKPKTDVRLLDLLDQERQQKRSAIREKKELEEKNIFLQEKVNEFEKKFNLDSRDIYEQTIHDFTLDYEKKISDLSLQLKDKDDQIKALNRDESSGKSIISNKQFRLLVAEEFHSLQRKFSEFQYDIMLSFYNTENVDKQLRNSFEQFFNQLITKTNSVGRVLLNDQDFSLFKDPREVNTRLKFTPEQYQAGLQVQALNIVFSDLCKYIFAIIKSVKASSEGNSFKIVPDDASDLIIIKHANQDDQIFFSIPRTEFLHISDSIRVFRPTSSLYKNFFIFISLDSDISLSNSNYQLLPHSWDINESGFTLKVPNIFDTHISSFQMGSYPENNCFIIQALDFTHEFNFMREFASKNKIEFSGG